MFCLFLAIKLFQMLDNTSCYFISTTVAVRFIPCVAMPRLNYNLINCQIVYIQLRRGQVSTCCKLNVRVILLGLFLFSSFSDLAFSFLFSCCSFSLANSSVIPPVACAFLNLSQALHWFLEGLWNPQLNSVSKTWL